MEQPKAEESFSSVGRVTLTLSPRQILVMFLAVIPLHLASSIWEMRDSASVSLRRSRSSVLTVLWCHVRFGPVKRSGFCGLKGRAGRGVCELRLPPP